MAEFLNVLNKQSTQFTHEVQPIYGALAKTKYLPPQIYKALSRQEYELLTKASENLLDTLPSLEVTDTKMRIMGKNELLALAVVQCTIPNTKIGNRNMPYDPRDGTVDDPRMGTLTMDRDCQTCHQNTVTCPGHLGYIQLARPVLNPLFRKAVIYIMNTFCEVCREPYFVNRDLPPEDQLDPIFEDLAILGPLGRLKALSERYSKSKQRPHPTHTKNPRYLNELSPAKKSVLFGTVEGKKTKFNTSAREEEKYSVGLNRRIKETAIGREEVVDAKDLRYIIFKEVEGIPSYVPIEDIRVILQSISADWYQFVGIEKDNFIGNAIIDYLPVIPPIARVYGTVDREPLINPITRQYCDILTTNGFLEKKSSNSPEYSLYLAQLYNQIKVLFDLLQEEIKGKKGIIRGLSMGKRVDYSGRSVLTTFNEMIFGQIAVPEIMRKYFTKTIGVQSYNITECRKLYHDKRVPYLIIGSDSSKKGNRLPVTQKMIEEYEPQIDDCIEVEGTDGDEVLFNRQPTLHKQGMMGHRALFVNINGVGLLSSYTSPYNADFDGDEGNLHKLQTKHARAEARYFASVGACIMNSQSNKPIMGLVYNCTTTGYVVTADGVMVPPSVFNNIIRLLSRVGNVGVNFLERLEKANAVLLSLYQKELNKRAKDRAERAQSRAAKNPSELKFSDIEAARKDEKEAEKDRVSPPPRVDRYSGKALFSLLLPEDFYYDAKGIKIRYGILIQGRLEKSHIGPVSGSIIHHLWKMYGQQRTMLFLTQGQWLLDEYIEKRGFTIGIKDCLAHNEDEQKKIKDIIDSDIERARLRIEALGPITEDMTALEKEQHERQIRSYLDVVTGIGKKVGFDALEENNPLNIMYKSGAKGSATNIGQILGILGQQYIKGVRPVKEMTLGTRTLPYFAPNDENIEARGFIRQSFMEGTDPAGMVFHMMASRIGIMDTALKTADTGHMHRRINKALEDFRYTYNGSVENMNGSIFQYNYSDGFDAGNLIPTKSDSLGDVINFIDLRATIGKLNSDAGFESV